MFMELATSSGCPGMKLECPFQKNFGNFFRPVEKHSETKQQRPGSWFSTNARNAIFAAGPSLRMESNGYSGRKNDTNSINRIYRRLDSCLVIPPPNGKKPRAIVKFLGGAFIGAVPEATYSYLLKLLANEGYLIISVPYNVTFDHAQAAKEIYETFHACFNRISTSGLPSANLTATEFVHLPLYSVGHSNGALLQALTGSYFSEKIPEANAIISYNNRPATEAVPYFEQLGPLVSQMVPVVEASPMYSLARNASGDAWKALLDLATRIPDYDQEALVSLTNFVDQLPSVLNQVKFNFDAIDETDRLEEALKPRVESMGGTLEKVLLTGNHVTPCIQEPRWQPGYLYTPADAIAQRLKTLSVNDIRVLSRTISNWFSCLEEK
ncbi:uncharacterized protein LOC131318460 isoform X2 [Rhododendron vialii]|uniref:uncharacterized protein LOC131318460 isoform X2 n=1 Tax=Rhododendron vialii TaxID=182163 RepID=UPI00265F936C|nr:uncharacterized protein LOC131318460 isoform X2 [Rhododendron vialii]